MSSERNGAPLEEYARLLAEFREAVREMRGLLGDSDLACARLRKAQAEAEACAAGRVKAYEAEYQAEVDAGLARLGDSIRETVQAAEKRIFARFEHLLKAMTVIPGELREASGADNLDQLAAIIAQDTLPGPNTLRMERKARKRR